MKVSGQLPLHVSQKIVNEHEKKDRVSVDSL